MQIVIGCTDGHTYKSRWKTEQEVQAGIDKVNGYIGKGDLANEQFTIDSMIETMRDLVYDKELNGKRVNSAHLTLNMEDGTEKGFDRDFNVDHIIWMDVIR